MIPEAIHLAPLVSIVITTEEYQIGWRKAQEHTSAGPSGYHFGHAKAAVTNQFLADVEATLTNIPCAMGYSPSIGDKVQTA